MRTAFFSHQSTRQANLRREGGAAPTDTDRPVSERQQALLLEVLRRAGGIPVGYAELREAGVEYPASVVSELELAGVAIERCFRPGAGSRRMLGVRLVPANPDPEPVAATATTPALAGVPRRDGWGPVRVYRTAAMRILVEHALAGASRLGTTGRKWARGVAAARPEVGSRMLAPLAVLAAAGVVGAVVLSSLVGGGGTRVGSARASAKPSAVAARRHGAAVPRRVNNVPARHAARLSTPTTPLERTTTTSVRRPPPPTTATTATQPSAPVSPALAANLDARGHELMLAGHYARAVPVLERTLQATGEQPGACIDPTTQPCLMYAFALYDLGRSLRLDGHPAAAIPILEQRLRIDNQRPVVAAELAQAQQQAGRRTG